MANRRGKKSAAQTPAPKAERIKGSKTNPKGTASSESSAASIKLSSKTMSTLSKKLDEFKEKYPSKKNVSLNDLKAVYRRGSGAYSQSHRPTITGGKPNSRAAWSFARVNKFLEKAAGKKVKAAYVQDDDLLKFSKGGKVEKLIEQGVVDLKFYKTTIQHANTYGFESTNPLYFQRIFVNKNDRNNGLGNDVLQYLGEYAKENNHDLIFGHIEQKSEPSIDVIKNLLQKNGYSTIEGNNDFYKYIDANASLNDDLLKYEEGGNVGANNCKEFILQNKSVLTNGFYFDMHDLSKLFDPYGQVPTHLNFTLVSYNSGGQSNLDVIDTINPTTLVDKLSKLLGLEKNQSYVVVHYVISKAKRLTNINQITTEKIVVVDRDMVVCENLNEYADGGTTITKFKNEQEMEQMIQCVQCDWTWSTADSDEADKYVCHKCGFDNSLFYDSEILKPTLTIQEIAEKHNEDIDYVIDQLVKGTEHEMEHTDNIDVAKKISLHHVAETPDYYEKLEKMELEDGGETEEVILEDNSTLVEIEIIEYLKQQMAESQEIMHCNDSRVFKTMICKTKIEIAEKRLSETENPEEQNVWNECIIIWSDTMKDIFENNIPVREYKDGGTPCGCGSVYEKGGLAYGNSHDKGGMPLEVSSTGQKIEIEGGEGVVNKRSMQMNKKIDFQGKKYTPCEVVSKINEMGGGVKFKCSDVNEIIAEDGHF